jgi:hypothetical protein
MVSMNRRIKRLLSLWLLAMLAFSHASFAMATCVLDRSELPRMLGVQATASSHEGCAESMPAGPGESSMSAAGCLSHCTADLQAFAFPDASVFPGADVPRFVLRQPSFIPAIVQRVGERPPRTIPPRVLLHSFLV